MILIITHKQDFTVDFVVDKLNKRNIPYHRFNCEDIEEDLYEIVWNPSFNFEIGNNNKFKSVWFRRVKLPHLPEHYSEQERQFLLSEYYALIQNFLLTLDVTWLSHPVSVYTAENKLFQLKQAKEIGFSIPETLVTNDRQKLKSFYFSKRHGLVIKPLSQNRIIEGPHQKLIFTNKLSNHQIDNLSDFILTPAIIQEYIQKSYEVRVTVVGRNVFSASVESQKESATAVDWRRKKLPFHTYQLPSDIQEKCIRLVTSMNLSFGAIDLIRAENGEYYFLEINPNGQWAWIETDTGLPISDAIIEFLS
jgi:glutathione synthase/RimK-type ligase-like ATP-grasp enzyme